MNSKTRHRRGWIVFVAAAVTTLTIAQISSRLVNLHLNEDSVYVVNSFLHLTYVRNTGGIFGVLQGNRITFAVLSSLFLTAVSVYVLRSKTVDKFEYLCFGIVVGAGAANVCDRLIYNAVIDFIEVQGIPYWHYIFNTADVMINVGLWPLLLRMILWGKTPLAEMRHSNPRSASLD